MKKIHMIAALLAMLLPTVTWAGSSHSTHYGKIAVEVATGEGTVYVSTSATATSGKTSDTWDCGGDSSGDSKTWYIYAKSNSEDWEFKGWSTSKTGTPDGNTTSPVGRSVSASGTTSGSPSTTTYYAHFASTLRDPFDITFVPGNYTVDGVAVGNINADNYKGLRKVKTVSLASSDESFLNWLINGEIVANATYSLTCESATTVEAEFLTADQVTTVTTLTDLTAALSNAAYTKITIPSGTSILVPSGRTVTVPSGKLLVIDGALNVVGQVSNGGTISGAGTLHKVSVTITQGDVITLKNAAGGECAKYCETTVSQNTPTLTGNPVSCRETWAALLNNETAYAITKQSPKAIRVTLNTTVAENKISGIAADSTSTPNGVDMIVADGNYVLIAETHLRGPIKEVKSSSSTYQRMGFIGTIDCAKNKLTSYCNQQGGNGAKVSFFNGTVVIDPTQSVDGDTSSSGSWGSDKYIQGFTYLKFYACTAITVKGLKNGNPMYFYGCGTSMSPATVTKTKYDATGFSAGKSYFYCGYYTYAFADDQDVGTEVYGGSYKTTNPPQTIKAAKDANGNNVTLTAKIIGDYYVVQPDTGDENVAMTGGKEYPTLGEAIEHATSGGLIELIGNVNLAGSDLEIASAKNVTISLAKKTIENGKIINRGILVLTDSATPAGRNNSDESGGIVTCDIENYNILDVVFGLYSGAIANKAGTSTIHNGLFTKSIAKEGGEISIKGGHFKDTAFTTAALSGFMAADGYKIFQANGYRSVCELPNGELTPETFTGGVSGYTATPYNEGDFELLRGWLSKKSKSEYTDANWMRLAELLSFYQVYNNYVIDSTLIFDRQVTGSTLSVKAGTGALSEVNIDGVINAGQRFLPLTAVMAQFNSTAKTYNALFAENHPSVSVAIADGGTGVNKGTICCIQPELGNSAHIFSKTLFTLGAGSNKAMIRPATGAATFYATLGAAMDAATDGGTVMLANDSDTALPLNKAGTYTFDTMGFAASDAVSVSDGLFVKSETAVDSSAKVLVPDAKATTYVVAQKVASVGGTFYDNLTEAVAAANGAVVTLLAATDETITLTAEGQTFTLNKNGIAFDDAKVVTSVDGSSVKVTTSEGVTVYSLVKDVVTSGEAHYPSIEAAIEAAEGDTVAVTVVAADTETIDLDAGKTLVVTVADGVTANVTVDPGDGAFIDTTTDGNTTTYESKKITVEMATPQATVEVKKIDHGTESAVTDTAEINAAVNQLTGNHDVSRTDNTDKLDVLDKITVTPAKIVEEVVGDKTIIRSVTFDVVPHLHAGQTLGEGQTLKFRLPVDAAATQLAAIVYHADEQFGIYPVQTYAGEKFIEVESADFSPYVYELLDGETANPIAAIGTTGYATLDAAVAAAQDGDTITLLRDVTLDAAVTVSKLLTIALDGHAITGTVQAGAGYAIATSASAYTVTGAGYAGEVLPTGLDMSGDVINVTAANAQYTLDGAYGDITGKTINFTENITERLDLGRCTKYAGSGTTTSGTKYTRTLSDVTFTALEGVTIAGFTADSGHVCNNGDYDYVRDQAVTGTNDGYYKYSSLTGITFRGLTVSDNIFVIYGPEGTTCGNITFDGCTFTGNTSDTAPINFNNTGSFQYGDITIQNCTINGSKAGIYINGGAAKYTIKNNYVVAGSNNAIQLWAAVGSAATVDIEGNFLKSDKYTVNLYRFESDKITFTGNAVVAGNRGHLGHFTGDASGNFWAPQGATPDASGNMTSALTEPIADTGAEPGENDITSSSYYSIAVVDASAEQGVDLNNLHTFVAQIGDVKYTSFAEAIAAANTADVTEIRILDSSITTSPDADWKVVGNKLVKKSYVAQIGTTKYETLAAAILAAQSGDTIEILDGTWGADAVGTMTTSESLSVRAKSLTIQPAEGATPKFTADVSLGYDDNHTANATMTVKGLAFENAKLSLVNYVQATVESCSFKGSGANAALFVGDSCDKTHLATGNYPADQITIKNCTFDGTAAGAPAIRVRNGGNVTVTGNTVANSAHNGILLESNNALDNSAARTVVVTANEITEWNAGNVAEGGRGIRAALGTLAEGSTVTLEGNVFRKGTLGLDEPDFAKITGMGSGTADISGNDWNDMLLSEVNGNGAVYSCDASASPTIGSVVTTRKEPVAQIGAVKYTTLAEAILAAQDGNTIEILDGTWGADAVGTLTTSEALSVRAKSLTIQAASGASPKFTSNVTLGYDDSSTRNATMTVKGLAFENAQLLVGNYAQATVEGCAFSNATLRVIESCSSNYNRTDFVADQVTIKDCTFNGTPSGEPAIRVRNSGNVSITGNTVANSAHNGILLESNGTVNTQVAKTVVVTDNTITEWNAGNVSGGGRGIRADLGTLAAGSTVTVEGNVFRKETLGLDEPDFAKITNVGSGTVDLSGNDWNDMLLSEVNGNGDIYTCSVEPTITTVITTRKEPVAQIGSTKYTTLAEAIAAVPTDGTETTIQMIGNDTLEKEATLSISNNKNIVLDLNGKTVSGSSDLSGANVYFFMVNTGCALTVKDTSEGAAGKISFASSVKNFNNERVTVKNIGGTLTLESGTIENTTGGGMAYAVNNAVNCGGSSTFVMTGGTISSVGGDGDLRIYNNAVATADCRNNVTISGGTLASTGIFCDVYLGNIPANYTGENVSTTLNISGGTINGLLDFKIRHKYNNNFTITGGDFTNAKLRVRKYASEYKGNEPTEPMVNISGGKFAFVDAVSAFNTSSGWTTTSSWTSYEKPYAVSGGVFNVEVPETACAEGYIPVANTDDETKVVYPYTVAHAVAQIVRNDAVVAQYASLADAVAAAQAGDTVQLLADVDLGTTGLVIAEGKNFTLDIGEYDITGTVNGKLITNNGTVVVNGTTGCIYNKDISAQGHDAFLNNGTATINGGWFGDSDNDKTNANAVNRGAAFRNFGTATINGGHFTACDNYTNGGYAYAIINGNDSNNPTLTINSADVYGKNNGNIANNSGSVTVKDGTFDVSGSLSYHSVYSYSGNTVVEGGTFTKSGNNYSQFNVEVDNDNASNPGSIAVSGGNFTKAVPEEYCADGYIPAAQDPDTGLYTVKQGAYVARNVDTGVGYETLDSAVSAATAGDTIVLLTNIVDYAGTTLVNKSLTINGAGHSITAAAVPEGGHRDMINAFTGGTSMLKIGGGAVTVTNITFDGHATHAYTYLIEVVNSGASLTVGDISLLNGGELDNSGTPGAGYGAGIHVNNASLVVKDGFYADTHGAPAAEGETIAKTDGVFPFTGILPEGSASVMFDLVDDSDDTPTVDIGEDLLLVGMIGAIDSETAQAILDYMQVPSRFIPYTLTLGNGIDYAFTGASPRTWNDIIDYGKEIMIVSTELGFSGLDTEETPVEVGLLTDTEIPDTFVFEDANFTVNGNGNKLTGTIEYTANAGELKNVVLTSGTILDISAEGATVNFGEGVVFAEGEKVKLVIGELSAGQDLADNVGDLTINDFDLYVHDAQTGDLVPVTSENIADYLPEGYEIDKIVEDDGTTKDLVVVKKQYAISWFNDVGGEIDTTKVEHGEVPTHDDAVKADSGTTFYTFAGWADTLGGSVLASIPAATNDAAYYAVFTEGAYVAQIGAAKYASLAAAFAAAQSGDTIQMIADSAETAGSTLAAGKSVVLDLNGKAISYTSAFGSAFNLISVNGSLTVDDTSAGADGSIAITSTANLSWDYAVNLFLVGNGGSLTIEKGSYSVTTPSYGYAEYVIAASNNSGSSTVTINGGTFTGNNIDAVVRLHDQYGRSQPLNVTVNGGDFTLNGSQCDSVIWFDVQNSGSGTDNASAASLAINGGTFTSTSSSPALDLGHSVDASGLRVMVAGGAFKSEGAVIKTRELSAAAIANIKLSGGIYSGDEYYNDLTKETAKLDTLCADKYACVANPDSATAGAYPWAVQPVFTVSFVNEKGDAPEAQTVVSNQVATAPSPAPSAANFAFLGWFAEGAAAAYDFASPVTADLTLTAQWAAAVASVTDGGASTNCYASLAAAFSAAQSGDTIQMIADSAETAGSTLAAGKSVVLDLNGKAISYTSAFGAAFSLISVNGSLTVDDTSADADGSIAITSTANLSWDYAVNLFAVGNGGSLTIEKGDYSVTTPSYGYAEYVIAASNNSGSSTVVINGGTFTGNNIDAVVRLHDQCNRANTELNVTVNGGDFTLNGSQCDSVIWFDVQNGKDITDNTSAAKLVVNGGTFTSTSGSPAIDFGHVIDASGLRAEINGGSFKSEGAVIKTRNLSAAAIANIKLSGGIYSGDEYYNDLTKETVKLDTLCADKYACVANPDSTTAGSYPWAVVQAAFTVIFQNYDGTGLQTNVVTVGEATPSYAGETPTKHVEGNGIVYLFDGWTASDSAFYAATNALPAIVADETFTAHFTETVSYLDAILWSGAVSPAEGDPKLGVQEVSVQQRTGTALRIHRTADEGDDLRAIGEADDDLRISWSTSDSAIATIDGDGLLTFHDLGTVTVTITVTDAFGNARSNSSSVTYRLWPENLRITRLDYENRLLWYDFGTEEQMVAFMPAAAEGGKIVRTVYCTILTSTDLTASEWTVVGNSFEWEKNDEGGLGWRSFGPIDTSAARRFWRLVVTLDPLAAGKTVSFGSQATGN